MIEKRVIGPKGQIVIPKKIREQLGLKRGSKVIFESENGEIKLKPQTKPEEFIEEFCAEVKKKLKERISLDELYTTELVERVIK
jgi:AbrB family looped-hinge helix DNA binding protein